MALINGYVWGESYGGGIGEPNDPYIISSPNHMQFLGADPNDWDKYFILTVDLDLSDFNGQGGNPIFNIIGNLGTTFTGVFDGSGHVISN